MVATSESRGKFVKSVKSWMDKYNAHGVDLDWEYPCSSPRSDPVKIACDKFQTVEDKGGSCPADNDNLLELVKDLRSGLGPDAIITIASQAGVAHAVNENLAAVTPYIDAWHVMSYDYAVSDITGSVSYTSPNSPLYTPVSAPNAVQMSVNDSMVYYLQSGVPANKIMVGLPLYAHTWYVPGLSGVDQWGKFGLESTIQGLCCGPFATTYGAQPGSGCQLCGSMMYSEIVAADCPTTWDEETRSDIAYCEKDGYDGGYTKAGTWMSYNSITSAKEFIQWEMSMGFSGIFVYSTDMDTQSAPGTYDYKYMNAMADEIAAGPKAPTPPTPQPAPTPRPPSPPTPGPPVCGSWTEVCTGCTKCSQCPTSPSKWYCADAM